METVRWIIKSVSYINLMLILFFSGLGFPVPEEITLMAGGAAAAMGHLDFVWVIVLSYVAIIGGDTVGFVAGRYLGDHIYDSRLIKFIFDRKRIRKARFLFFKRGTWAVVIARFLPGLRVSMFFVAGSMKVSFSKFLIADSIALILSAPVGLGLGWFLGDSLLTPEGYATAHKLLRDWNRVIIAVIICIVAVFVVMSIYKRKRLKRARKVE